MDRQTDRPMDDRQKVFTVARPEHSLDELKSKNTMSIGLNEGNIGRNVCPGFGKSTYGASLPKTSETILETATL